MPASEHRRAARAVARQKWIPKKGTPEDPGRAEILEMLGLATPYRQRLGRRELIEPTSVERDLNRASGQIVEIHGEMKNSHFKHDTISTPLRDRSLLPPGLRKLPDPTPVPKRRAS